MGGRAGQAQAAPFGGGVGSDHAGVVQVQQVGQHLVGVEAVPVGKGTVGGQRRGQVVVCVGVAGVGELDGLQAGTAAWGTWSTSQRGARTTTGSRDCQCP